MEQFPTPLDGMLQYSQVSGGWQCTESGSLLLGFHALNPSPPGWALSILSSSAGLALSF